LFYLAANYPREFQDFIVGLKPLRSVDDMVGEAASFLLGRGKFFYRGGF
jgi:hypothetical protein